MIKMTMMMRDAHDHFLEWQCESARRLFANPQPHITTDRRADHDIPNTQYGTARARAHLAPPPPPPTAAPPQRGRPLQRPPARPRKPLRQGTQTPATEEPPDRRGPKRPPTPTRHPTCRGGGGTWPTSASTWRLQQPPAHPTQHSSAAAPRLTTESAHVSALKRSGRRGTFSMMIDEEMI